MLIYITEPNEIHNSAKEILIRNGHKVIEAEPLLEDKKKVEAIFIRTYTTVNNSLLTDFPRLKFILRAGVGLDNIDTDLCKKKGIQILNSPGANANSVAEYVVCIMIMMLRHIGEQNKLLTEHKWRDKNHQGEDLKGRVIGLVGCGFIGKLLADKLQGFEVKKILGYDPFIDEETMAKNHIVKADLETILETSDIISLHLPLLKETKDIISLTQLKKMKKNSYIINTSRGGIINEEDLIYVLRENLIAGAALDVFENEPKINKNFLNLKNIFLTPHIAGYTKEADIMMSIAPVKRFLEAVK